MAEQHKKSAQHKKKGHPKEGAQTISRRKFLEGVLVASAATGVATLPTTAAAAAPGAVARAGTAGLTVLTPREGQLLTAVLNCLVPAEGTRPGAGDIGIATYIDDALVDAPHLRRPILDVLSAIHTADVYDRGSRAELEAELTRIEREQKASFDVLLQATYTGYYSHPQVLKAIGWEGPREPDEPFEPFDVAALDEVRRRGPFYRSA